MKRIYGAWVGDPMGRKEDITRCIVEVWPQSGSWKPWQCLKKRGHGPDGLYYKQHAKKLEEKE